jgi:hypothetical protein
VEDIQLNAATPPLSAFTERNHFRQTRFTGTGTNIVLDGTLLQPAVAEKTNVNGNLNLVLNGISLTSRPVARTSLFAWR